MSTQTEKGSRFRALHQRDRAFIIPNPWDAGTARLLARMALRRWPPPPPAMPSPPDCRMARWPRVDAQTRRRHRRRHGSARQRRP